MKLIKFQVQDISVPDEWDRPYYRTLEYGDRGKAIGIMDESITTMPMIESKKVDYELVWLRDGKKDYKFYVNFEQAKLAIPFLEGVVGIQVSSLKKENVNLNITISQLQGKVRRYESLWFIRFHNWIKQLITKH